MRLRIETAPKSGDAPGAPRLLAGMPARRDRAALPLEKQGKAEAACQTPACRDAAIEAERRVYFAGFDAGVLLRQRWILNEDYGAAPPLRRRPMPTSSPTKGATPCCDFAATMVCTTATAR